MRFLLLFLFFAIAAELPAHAGSFEIALVQYNADLRFGRYEENRAELTRFAEEAVAHGSKLIVFPEGSLYGYGSPEGLWCRPGSSISNCRDVNEAAELIPSGKSSVYWEAFAKKHKVFVLFNIPEKSGEKFFNTTAVFGPAGYVTLYRKRHLYSTDLFYATRGDRGGVVFKTPAGPFGLLICMDANFPDLYEQYKQSGVSNLILPMDWDEDPEGRGGARPARTFFQEMAQSTEMNLFVSDVSAWDGTGAYRVGSSERERNGLPSVAVGRNGVSYHLLPTR